MTGHIYLDVILEQHVCLFRGAMGAEFLFMDDNARPHRANIVDECLQSEDITRMDWSAYSPDLNPIENVWDMLGRRIAAHLPSVYRNFGGHCLMSGRNSYNLDKQDASYDRAFYCAQKPRRESATRVDEFFEDSNLNVSQALKTIQTVMNQNTVMPVGPSMHLNSTSFNNNTCGRKSCPPLNSINNHTEELFKIMPSTSMSFQDISESSDLPGLFDSITPPHLSPATCIKTEKIQPDPCAFPPSSPEFASLLDVSLPEQVIVKREPNLENNNNIQLYPSNMAVSHNTYMGHYAMSRLMMPLTPPISEPGSDSVDSVNVRTTPPPPYLSTTPWTTALDANDEQDMKSAYNRRNNPELEKRRTHRCLFPEGDLDVIHVKDITERGRSWTTAQHPPIVVLHRARNVNCYRRRWP
ncbi:dendritic arbor reduction protein 1 [Trichonephila clavipes]|nr:dendritic arbor reduction protein 1 [Trichonephila clavipes]